MKWFLKGTVVGIVSAIVILAATAALAGSGVGAIFNLGRTNSVNRQSALVGKTTGAMLRVQNKGSGPAATFQVAAGKAPFGVNSNVKVAKLNADMLDGIDSTGFYAAGSKVIDSAHADNATNAINANTAQNSQFAHQADTALVSNHADTLGEFRLTEETVVYKSDAPSNFAPILLLGDLTLSAECLAGDDLRIKAETASDHAWLRVGGQGDSDFNVGEDLVINVGSDSGVLVYHNTPPNNSNPQVVTFQWGSWENGIGYDCQLWGTALYTP